MTEITPGRAAYEAMHASREGRDPAGGHITWERLDQFMSADFGALKREDMEAAAQAVLDAATEGSLRACGYTLADVGRFLEAEAAAQEPQPAPGGTHIGRSWEGHGVEDECPCPKAPCGLVVQETASEECDEHPLSACRTIRQSHRADQCPAQPQPESPLHRLSGLIAGWRARVRHLEEYGDTAEAKTLRRVIDQVLPVVEDAARTFNAASTAKSSPGLRAALEDQVRLWRHESEADYDDDGYNRAGRGSIAVCANELAQILARHPAVSPGQQVAYDEDAEAEEGNGL